MWLRRAAAAVALASLRVGANSMWLHDQLLYVTDAGYLAQWDGMTNSATVLGVCSNTPLLDVETLDGYVWTISSAAIRPTSAIFGTQATRNLCSSCCRWLRYADR